MPNSNSYNPSLSLKVLCIISDPPSPELTIAEIYPLIFTDNNNNKYTIRNRKQRIINSIKILEKNNFCRLELIKTKFNTSKYLVCLNQK